MTQHRDDGFSLVEVVVAVFLLGLVSLAVLPLIVGVAALSVTNRDTASATGYAQAQIAAIRDEFPLGSSDSCATVETWIDAVAVHVPPPAARLKSAPELVECDVDEGLATATFVVTDGVGNPLARLSTQVPVTG